LIYEAHSNPRNEAVIEMDSDFIHIEDSRRVQFIELLGRRAHSGASETEIDSDYIVLLLSEKTSRCWFVFYASMDYTAAMSKSATSFRRKEIQEKSYYKAMLNWIAQLPPRPNVQDQKMVQDILESQHCTYLLSKLYPEKEMYMINSAQNLNTAASVLKNWSPPVDFKCYAMYDYAVSHQVADNLLAQVSKAQSNTRENNCFCTKELCKFIAERVPFYMGHAKRNKENVTTVRPRGLEAWALLSTGMKLDTLPGGKEYLSVCSWFDLKIGGEEASAVVTHPPGAPEK